MVENKSWSVLRSVIDMTIDEAIAKYREKGNPYGTCCEGCEKEHEQLAEWLEDYKRIKMLIPIQQALKNEYNKAIDDLLEDANEMAIEVDVDTYTMKAIGIGLLENIAEQLKAGGKNV